MLIYSIVEKTTKICVYVGSTRSTLTRRIWGHKSSFDLGTLPLYQYMKNNGGFEAFEFLELETINSDESYVILQRERYYFDLLKPICNAKRPMITAKEYMDMYREKSKNYYYAHREEISKKNKEKRAQKKSQQTQDGTNN